MSPAELAAQLGSGLLSFPVTPFTEKFEFNEHTFRENLSWLSSYKIAGLFAGGGTGEFFSLSPAEAARVVSVAVAEVAGVMPVIAGVGYGTVIAREMAARAEEVGADGILLLPPYLINSTQAGLARHVEEICDATKLGVIVYNRDNAILQPDTLEKLCDRCPNLVGYKDGIGDIELMTRVQSRMGDRLTYIGGLPTAETFALPYLEMGVTTYSSAMFNFVPEFSVAFYDAVRRRDRQTVAEGLRNFVLPLIEIRNRKPGYAISIIKAGLKLIGRDSGPVRPPLTDLTDEEFGELAHLVSKVVKSSTLAAAE